MSIDARKGAAGLLILATFLATACGGDAQADGPETGAASSESLTRVINVETSVVETGVFTEIIRLTGTAQANRDVTVAAEESGTITRILTEKGARVGRGQPIARIDDRILSAQVEQARAQAALARETWDRRKRLYEDDRVGSELAYLEARYLAEQAAANLAALEQRLARTTIRAPFAGVLDSRAVELGSMVTTGTPVARVVDLDPVKITGGVPERFAADVAPGASATVTFEVLEGRRFEGRITYVGSAVNPRNRTFPVELTMPNPGGVIKPEMVASIDVVRRVLQDVIVVPQQALVRVESGYVAFVAAEREGSPVAEMRPVTVGPSQRNQVVVTSGIEPGDRLIVLGQQTVANGDRIRIVSGS